MSAPAPNFEYRYHVSISELQKYDRAKENVVPNSDGDFLKKSITD